MFFFILRAINIYGDKVLWTNYESIEMTIMSFFQITKYPPSLLYLLITIGSMLLFLGNSEHLLLQEIPSHLFQHMWPRPS